MSFGEMFSTGVRAICCQSFATLFKRDKTSCLSFLGTEGFLGTGTLVLKAGWSRAYLGG